MYSTLNLQICYPRRLVTKMKNNIITTTTKTMITPIVYVPHNVSHEQVDITQTAKHVNYNSYDIPQNLFKNNPDLDQDNTGDTTSYYKPDTEKKTNIPFAVYQLIFQNAIYVGFFLVFLYSLFLQKKSLSNQSRMSSINKAVTNPEEVSTTFKDVAGLHSIKLELVEIVEFLKNPEKFQKVGARIPKGCLLTGEPGLGKTLLARAVAGEAGVPFFACSASEFIELFVGVGAARIRDIFKKAKEVAPCIIFIDEIDAIGKMRGISTGHDEREQAINQLLTEMDGFNENTGVIIMAATNRVDILDKALVRPGRFDRQFALYHPSLTEREEILKVHCTNKPLDLSVDLVSIAKITAGLSGADLANIVNEAAILTARRNGDTIMQIDFLNAIDRVTLGSEKSTSLISPAKKKLIACHEAGHAIVALKVGEYDSISKISIIPRGKSGGVTVFEQLPEHSDTNLFSRKYLENKLAVLLGGRAAEEIVFGEYNITTGAYHDFEVVQQLTRAMVVSYGFTETLGQVSWSSEHTSPQMQQKIDEEILRITRMSYTKAKNIINNNFHMFNIIAEHLYTNETLTKADVEALLQKHDIK